jgi:hypothetical protein
VFFKIPHATRPPEDPAAALLGLAEDLKTVVRAAQQGHRVYLSHPYRMARAIRRHLKSLNRELDGRGNGPVAQPTEPQSAVATTRRLPMLRVVTPGSPEH